MRKKRQITPLVVFMLTFHRPNSPSEKERAQIYEVTDTGDTLVLKINRI